MREPAVCHFGTQVLSASLDVYWLRFGSFSREKVIRDEGRTSQLSLSSGDFTSILDKYVLHWMGGGRIRWSMFFTLLEIKAMFVSKFP